MFYRERPVVCRQRDITGTPRHYWHPQRDITGTRAAQGRAATLPVLPVNLRNTGNFKIAHLPVLQPRFYYTPATLSSRVSSCGANLEHER